MQPLCLYTFFFSAVYSMYLKHMRLRSLIAAISSLSPVLYGFEYVTAIAIVVTVLLAAIFVGCLIRAKD